MLACTQAEQEEYVSEGIKWTPIDFFNNKVRVLSPGSLRPVSSPLSSLAPVLPQSSCHD